LPDDKGLALEVRPSGQKAWLYRYRLFGRRKNFHPEVIRAFR
jgi:hypothetical protein